MNFIRQQIKLSRIKLKMATKYEAINKGINTTWIFKTHLMTNLILNQSPSAITRWWRRLTAITSDLRRSFSSSASEKFNNLRVSGYLGHQAGPRSGRLTRSRRWATSRRSQPRSKMLSGSTSTIRFRRSTSSVRISITRARQIWALKVVSSRRRSRLQKINLVIERRSRLLNRARSRSSLVVA